MLGVTYVTANALVAKLEMAGVLKEVTSWGRNRLFRFQPYVALFSSDGAIAETGSSAVQE